MKGNSTKPYLIRAIYDWCSDSELTPYVAVKVDDWTRVPNAYVKDGEIVINISAEAVRSLRISNQDITCEGRFGGVSHSILIPMTAVIGIFSKETGQGLVFQGNDSAPTSPTNSGGESAADKPNFSNKPRLRVVK